MKANSDQRPNSCSGRNIATPTNKRNDSEIKKFRHKSFAPGRCQDRHTRREGFIEGNLVLPWLAKLLKELHLTLENRRPPCGCRVLYCSAQSILYSSFASDARAMHRRATMHAIHHRERAVCCNRSNASSSALGAKPEILRSPISTCGTPVPPNCLNWARAVGSACTSRSTKAILRSAK